MAHETDYPGDTGVPDEASRGQQATRPEPHRVRRTRTGETWVGIGVAIVFVIALIIFIAQNSLSTAITFLAWHAHIAVAVALLIAAVGGAAVVALVGTARIV
jgi:uncharacterized integral membrane protein